MERWLRQLMPARSVHNPLPADNPMAEWTECRATIGRLDGVLADTRKYGFSLVTLLLTASALITNANSVTDRVASSSVVIVLVLVLFLMDRYWWVLLRKTVERSMELETTLGIQISRRLGQGAQASHNTQAASAVYLIFVVVACLVAVVAVAPAGFSFGLVWIIVFTVLAILAILGMHIWFEALLLPEPHAEAVQ